MKVLSQTEVQHSNVQSGNSNLSAKGNLIMYKIYLTWSFENITTNDKSIFFSCFQIYTGTFSKIQNLGGLRIELTAFSFSSA